MTLDPEVAAIVAAFGGATLLGMPRLQRSFARRRRALRECLNCGRCIVLGERTCDCETQQ